MSDTTLSLEELLALIEPDRQAVADGRRRMLDIWHGRATDSLPIIFGAEIPGKLAANGGMIRHVEDAGQMLYDCAAGMVSLALAGSDAQLAIRANTGTGTLATIAGCRQILSEHALPWTAHLTRAEIEDFDPTADLASRGVMPRVRELYAYFREMLPACVNLYCADTQSPFDLAHLLCGDTLFYEIYDDPAYVHRVLEKSTKLYIDGSKLMKEWIAEPLDGGYHDAYALGNGGIRICEDTSTLLSAELLAEFSLPYQQRAMAPFNGGFLHYCGSNPALYRGVLANPWVRGLNFGQPELHDMNVVIPELIAAGKCYVGSLNREEGEALETYFRRVIGYTRGARTGLIFNATLTAEERADPHRVLDLWRGLQ